MIPDEIRPTLTWMSENYIKYFPSPVWDGMRKVAEWLEEQEEWEEVPRLTHIACPSDPTTRLYYERGYIELYDDSGDEMNMKLPDDVRLMRRKGKETT
jgi:hypothetical protein